MQLIAASGKSCEEEDVYWGDSIAPLVFDDDDEPTSLSVEIVREWKDGVEALLLMLWLLL